MGDLISFRSTCPSEQRGVEMSTGRKNEPGWVGRLEPLSTDNAAKLVDDKLREAHENMVDTVTIQGTNDLQTTLEIVDARQLKKWIQDTKEHLIDLEVAFTAKCLHETPAKGHAFDDKLWMCSLCRVHSGYGKFILVTYRSFGGWSPVWEGRVCEHLAKMPEAEFREAIK